MNSGGAEHVDVAVTVIRRGHLLLAGYNAKWEAYTLPMTRRKDVISGNESQSESWKAAAQRNVDEWFGARVASNLTVLTDLTHVRQSDRDLRIRDYHFRVFEAQLADETPVRVNAIAEWLSPDEFSELYQRPISPTARLLVDELRKRGKLD